MTSTDYQEAAHQGAADKPLSGDRLLGSLKEAAGWPGADRNELSPVA